MLSDFHLDGEIQPLVCLLGNPVDSWSVLRPPDPAIDKMTREEVFLDLVFTNLEELVKEVKVGGNLRCSDCALVEVVILRNMGLAKNEIRTLNL